MATAAVLEDEKLDCPICLEKIRNPKQLPCLHAFCESCLHTYIEATMKSESSSFPCPVCRITVTTPTGLGPAMSMEKWVAELPFDNAMFSDIAISDTTGDPQCDPCARIEENVKAICWCQECNEFMCKSCLDSFHKRLKDSKQHKITDVFGSLNTLGLYVRNMEPCAEHKGKTYEIFCLDHSKMCCVLCLLDHRECRNVQSTEEVSDRVSTGKYDHSVLKDLAFLRTEITKLVGNRTDRLAVLKKQKDTLTVDCETRIDVAIKKLQQLKLHLRDKISNFSLPEWKQCELQIEAFNWFLENLSQNIKLLSAVKEHGNAKQTFFTLQKIRKNLQIQGEQFEKIATDICIDTVFLEAVLDPALMTLINSEEPLFSIATSHSKGWKHSSKNNITERLEKLNLLFSSMVHGGTRRSNIDNRQDVPEGEDMMAKADFTVNENSSQNLEDLEILPSCIDEDKNEEVDDKHAIFVGYSKEKRMPKKDRMRKDRREKRRFHNQSTH